MALHGKLLEQLIVLLHLITGVQLVLSAPQPNDPSCNRTCGNVSIPYPFGTSKGCYLDPSFLIICNYSFQPPKPFLGVDHNIDVLNISPDDGELRVSNLVFRRCKLWLEFDNQPSLRRISTLLNLSKFRISIEKNSIFSVGCNFFAYISGSHEQDYKLMSGCVSFCGNSSGLVNGSCSGVGCCHSAIPGNTTNYNLNVQSIYTNGSSRTSGQSCGLGFIGET
ncbi:wall-associated receptor kinase 2-like isoform X2 [Carya illinoinensis]|nr:wall-associated receptor kinase 2-like isoform X2 [Carya illinoinensis]